MTKIPVGSKLIMKGDKRKFIISDKTTPESDDYYTRSHQVKDPDYLGEVFNGFPGISVMVDEAELVLPERLFYNWPKVLDLMRKELEKELGNDQEKPQSLP